MYVHTLLLWNLLPNMMVRLRKISEISGELCIGYPRAQAWYSLGKRSEKSNHMCIMYDYKTLPALLV
ncbi:hypothetical protein I7I53_06566 [Histoplasma capsulatum var. duboisii H88]|uniref:Uncharacterized protein n=1 Tax=Ajellomyces capsulatus (strain H88) TaxID=544711 RepID=A0A8A1LBG7_AJEC8|nr:hypothetical protein I7I53_06566 [Histoplasma capsulatum var. duboisii H88]